MRTLAFAYHDAPADHTEIEEITRDMIWLGFVAIADPIRPEVPEAIQTCRNAGIKVTIVTGDNSETAKEIARQIHFMGVKAISRAIAISQDGNSSSYPMKTLNRL